MNWYYVEAGQQTGPVTEAELLNLVSTGRIQPDTLVWREGMANWQPYSAVQQAAVSTAAPPQATTDIVSGSREVVCAECGKIFSSDNAIQYGAAWVCAACKPIFVQKIKEGAALPVGQGELRYAGFWIRFVAKFLDNLIMGVLGIPVGLILGFAVRTDSLQALLVQQGLSMLIGIAIGMTYTGLFVGKYAATPGKMILQLKIVRPDGGAVSYGRAFGRYFAEILSGCPTLLIGYIIAGFDEQKRALHDRICDTRVIWK